MRFLVNEFTGLEDLKKYVPNHQHQHQHQHQQLHPVVRTEVVPQKVLFKDEKYIQEMIDILSQLIEDANLNGDPLVHKINSNYTCTCFYIMPSIAHITLIDGNWRPNDLQEHQGWKA